MNHLEIIPKLEEQFPELTGKLSLKDMPLGGRCRIYVNLNEKCITSYIELKLYRDDVVLAFPKTYLKTERYVSKYNKNQAERNCFFKVKDMAKYINKELICRGKTKKLEKTPKYKEWVSATKAGFLI